jgi:hypothetical protein
MIYLFYFLVLVIVGLVTWVIIYDIYEHALGHSPKSKRGHGNDNF